MLSPSTPSPGLWVNPAWTPGTPGTFAVVIGASSYDHVANGRGAPATDTFGLTQLSASALSAYRFFQWLRDGYANTASPIAMCWVLLSPSDAELSVEPGIGEHPDPPTLPNVQRVVGEWFAAMRQLPADVAKASRSFFWFSGHGFDVGNEHLLLPSDYLEPPLSMPDRAISAHRLVSAMEALETRDQFFFLDTGREQLQQLQMFGITGMQLLPLPTARNPMARMSVTLGASMPSGRAFQPANPKDGISFFARAVLEGLSGKGGLAPDCRVSPCVVRLFPFVSFVQSRVQQLTSEYNVTGQIVRLQLEGSSHDAVLTEVSPPVVQEEAAVQTAGNPPAARAPTTNAYALAIGIDTYPTGMTLRGCAEDARRIAELLSSGGIGGEAYDVRVLTDGDATRDGILSALSDVAANATSDATVVIFFAGHGANTRDVGASLIESTDSALVPVDYSESDRRLVTTADLERALADMSARHVVVLADASYANRIMRRGPGRVLVSAGREGEHAYESRDREASGVGEFSSALIDGLRGAAASDDGIVRVLDLYEFVHRRVAGKGLQHPFLGGDSSENFALVSSPNEVSRELAPAPDGYLYDAYLSFATDDASLVWKDLAPRLASAGLRISVSEDLEDTRLYRVATPERGILQSRRSLVLVSGTSLAEATSEFERLAAATIGLESAASHTIRITTTEDLEQRIRTEPPIREWLRQAEGWTLRTLVEREDLVGELADRLRSPLAEPSRPATVFISSDRHDRTTADRLATALRGAGQAVWLDHDFGPGVGADAARRRAIEECTIFIPILSRTSLTRQAGSPLDDWRAAIERLHRQPEGSRFIVPVAIDDVMVEALSTAAPRELLAIQWSRIPDGQPTASWLETMADVVWRERSRADVPAKQTEGGAQLIPPELIPRLSSSSRRALLWAEGYRGARGSGVVDTGHLLRGLYEKPEGWAHTLLHAADFDGTWAALLATGLGGGSELPDASRAPSSALETMRVSAAVAAALTEARRLADENRATTVQARYLLAGLLAVPNEPAAQWMADRVEMDLSTLRRLILGAVDGSPPADQVRRLRRRGARLVLASDARSGTPIYAAAFSPDGTTVATAHYDGGVRLWNVADGALVRLLGPIQEEGHGWTNCLAWSPNGDALVWGTQDGSILFWDANADTVGTIPGVHDGQVVSIRVSPDGRLLVSTGEDSSVQIRDWTDREMLGHGAGVYPVRRGISGIEFDVDQGLVFVASPDGSVTRLPPSAPGWA